jgi:hypothetical protein
MDFRPEARQTCRVTVEEARELKISDRSADKVLAKYNTREQAIVVNGMLVAITTVTLGSEKAQNTCSLTPRAKSTS